MLTIELGNIVRVQNGRTIPIAKFNEFDRFRALCSLGVPETVACAVVKGLITVPVKTI